MKRSFVLLIILFCGLQSRAQDVSSIRDKLESLTETVPGLVETVDFTLVGAPLSELLRAVAETHSLNVSIGEMPQTLITNNFNNVQVKDLIVFLCEEYSLGIRFTNNIFTFYTEYAPPPKRDLVTYDEVEKHITLNAQNDPLIQVTEEVTAETGYNLIVNQSIANQKVTGYIRNLPFEVAIENFAEANNLKIIKKSDFVYQVLGTPAVEAQNGRNSRQRSNTSRNRSLDINTYTIKGLGYVSVNADQVPAIDLVKSVCERLGINYLLLNDMPGQINCRLDSVRFGDFLEVILKSSNQSYSVSENDVYLIGEEQGGKLSGATVYSFKNRSVEGIDEVIPKVLLNQVQIQLFNDLNAIIITGSDQSTQKVTAFLQEIDKPVPNVLIEVLVIEFRKGNSLKTGVKAFLSDSVPSTSGQIFSGLDVTLSSQTFNKFLNNLDSRGIMNLGRVTPKFYATIQAMEENNNLNIRSTPKLSTLNGHEASLTIGQSVYYLIETQNVTGGVNPIVTVTPRYEKVEANLDLKINPFVSDHEDVTLTIEAEFSDFITPEVIGAPPGNSTRKFISKIRVKNEEMVVIGGLEEVSKSEGGSGIPLLSRIPIIKWLFSSKTKENSESKLLIFVKPTIVY